MHGEDVKSSHCTCEDKLSTRDKKPITRSVKHTKSLNFASFQPYQVLK